MEALWTWIADADPWLTGAMLGALMASGWYAGWRWGRRGRARGAAELTESKLGDASLAILGLLLAFTFSMALNKYDRRRDALVNDSNAIGDLYTCASLIAEPQGGRLRAVPDQSRYSACACGVVLPQPGAAGGATADSAAQKACGLAWMASAGA